MEATSDHDREHVTPFFYNHPERFALHNYQEEPDLSHHRWTLDTEEDYRFMQTIYSQFDNDPKRVTTRSVLELLENRPDIFDINQHVEQKHHDDVNDIVMNHMGASPL